MSIVAVQSTAGGSGKSTICAHLAVAATGHGRRVLVLDCNQDRLLCIWARSLRRSRSPVVMPVSGEVLTRAVEEGLRAGFDLVLIDCPSSAVGSGMRAAALADHVLIPVRATVIGMHHLADTLDRLRMTVDGSWPQPLQSRHAMPKAAIILNGMTPRIKPRTMREIERAIADLGAGGLCIVGCLSERSAYTYFLAEGVGETGCLSDRSAACEIEDLYQNMLALERARSQGIGKLLEGGYDGPTRLEHYMLPAVPVAEMAMAPSAKYIFISYSKMDREIALKLHDALRGEGYATWWAENLTAGEEQNEVILDKLNAAAAVIVLWSGNAIKSRWVHSEAMLASRDGKLLPTRTPGLDYLDIPPPFPSVVTVDMDDMAGIRSALQRLKVEPILPRLVHD